MARTDLEADGRKLRGMVPVLRERFWAKHNVRDAALHADPRKDETERFRDALAAMEEPSKVLRACLDGHSRSRMEWCVMLKGCHVRFRKEDLEGLSEELLRDE